MKYHRVVQCPFLPLSCSSQLVELACHRAAPLTHSLPYTASLARFTETSTFLETLTHPDPRLCGGQRAAIASFDFHDKHGGLLFSSTPRMEGIIKNHKVSRRLFSLHSLLLSLEHTTLSRSARKYLHRHCTCRALLHRTHRFPEWHQSTRLVASSRTNPRPSLYDKYSRSYDTSYTRSSGITARSFRSRPSSQTPPFDRINTIADSHTRSQASRAHTGLTARTIAAWHDAHANRTAYLAACHQLAEPCKCDDCTLTFQ